MAGVAALCDLLAVAPPTIPPTLLARNGIRVGSGLRKRGAPYLFHLLTEVFTAWWPFHVSYLRRCFFGWRAGTLDHSFVGTEVISKYFAEVARPDTKANNSFCQAAFSKVVIRVAEVDQSLALFTQRPENVLTRSLPAEMYHGGARRVVDLVAQLMQRVVVSQIGHSPAKAFIQQAHPLPGRAANHVHACPDALH